jgi:signal transduction histidine kinase
VKPLDQEFEVLLTEQLREQMNNLSAAVQLLTGELRERDEKCRQYLAIMNQSIYRMMRMVGNLEYMHEAESRKAIEGQGLDLAGLCQDLANQVRPLAEKTGVSFTYRADVERLTVCGDMLLLRRMLLNLIANAIQAAGPGGETGLYLSTGRERAVLTVWDNGPGLEKMQVAGGLLDRPEGLGLGLKVARNIAELHGGAIVFEQREGSGLKAVVSLPLCQLEGEAVKSPVSRIDGNGGFAPVMVELAGVLPFQAFLFEELE